ncbi:hypothetical protein TrST_g12239 [Triparma strigata]|uniref:tyrosine--tRNA ligase n=1 Tax=Triparma strigata TaxID=1606541 RepID=A0A9W7BFQ5_9STRA|nr:hypothetical protein TrST_g12239 [Triparma strigata]
MVLHPSLGISATPSFSVFTVGGAKPPAAPPASAKAAKAANVETSAAKKANAAPKQSTKKKAEKKPAAPKDSAKAAPVPMSPELRAKYETILSVGEECQSPAELEALLQKKDTFNAYDGFEPSGRMHIAQGVFKAVNVNKITSSNGVFIFWVADWFALMNDKMGGDLDKIKVVGEYLKQVWAASGMNMDDNKVIFKWASDEITNNAATYWPKMLDIASRFNITRIKKCCQIMGRLEGNLSAAQVLYPLMQCTDVFFLKADVCQLGVDQRKVNMLARDYCDAAKIKFKPVILSHHMLYGLKAGQEKMSKSDPDSAIFMEDTKEDVHRKIMNAYCPLKPAEKKEDKGAVDDAGKESMNLVGDDLKNPCLDYIENIIFGSNSATFKAGSKTYATFEEVKADFLSETLKENDLKQGLIEALNLLLEPVRQHFTNNAVAKDLLAKVQQYKKEKAPLDRKFRRMDPSAIVPPNSDLVFCPTPSNNPSLQVAVNLLSQLQGKASPVLFLADWSAKVLSACGGEAKVVDAYFAVVVNTLKALAPDTMASVKVVKQSDLILTDPSNYWISVINVGRFFNLNVLQEGYEDADAVGNVIARMMRVADCISLNSKTISFMAQDKMSEIEASIIKKYFDEIPLDAPDLSPCTGTNVALSQNDGVHATENSEYFLLDDPKVHGKLKLKKSFCEPGNVEFCPPISIASFFALQLGEKKLEIKRSPENGGDVDYTSEATIKEEFLSGKLHPGDLKAAVTAIMVDVLTKLTAGAKGDAAWKKSAAALKADIKKQAKKKK